MPLLLRYPNLKSVRELCYKRGYGKVNKQRTAITDNSVIEAVLGPHGACLSPQRPSEVVFTVTVTTLFCAGIICMEDLIHEIVTVGPHFKEANNFLWPFNLKAPLGGLERKLTDFVEGGQAGNRDTKINALIQRML